MTKPPCYKGTIQTDELEKLFSVFQQKVATIRTLQRERLERY